MKTAGIALLGVAIGFTAGWFGARASADTDPPSSAGALETQPAVSPGRASSVDEVELDAPAQSERSRAPEEHDGDRDVMQRVAPSGQSDPEALFSAPLLAHHEEQLLVGWRAKRQDAPSEADREEGLRDFKKTTLECSATIGGLLAEKRTGNERLETALDASDGIELLAFAATRSWVPDHEFVASEAFEEIVAVRSSSGAVDGATFAEDRGMPVEEGMVIVFGPGVHSLEERRLRGSDGTNLPKDVTVRGAGKDLTLLQIGDIGVRGPVERLRFENLTLDAQNDGLFDLRTAGAVLGLDRVRIVRFDAGHGGCTLFSSRAGMLLHAQDSEIIGGYGRAPGMGDLIRSGPFVANFKNCVFELIELRGLDQMTGVRAVFEGCRFRLQGTDPLAWRTDALRLHGCTSEPIPRDTPRSELQKKLTDLFPDAQ